MDGALASRARRSRGARPGDLHDRVVVPSRRAGGAYACATRRWRTHAGLAAAFAAGRRTDSIRAYSGGTVGPASAPRLRGVAAFIPEPQGKGFAALARRAGLKAGVLFPFRAALAAIKAQGAEG